MTVLITGSAGFIGFNLAAKLLEQGIKVVGLDNLNSYYDPKLKQSRLNKLFEISSKAKTNFIFEKASLEDKEAIIKIFEKYKPLKVVNLAAQAGVRYSIENPSAYIQSNIVGFSNILEECRNFKIKHLVYASSSSVYGGNTNLPFSEKNGVDHPVSLYAATKRSNELIAHSYSHLYGIPSTGLRFFTVYGPWGRPDMALFLFTKAILNGEPIKIFNNGNMIRDFTYIDDIVQSLLKIINKPPLKNNFFDTNSPDPSSSWAPHKIFNIGNSNPIPLMEYIISLEKALGMVSKKEYLPMQAGDVEATAADTSLLEEWISFKPRTSVANGINKFVTWYKEYYGIKNEH